MVGTAADVRLEAMSRVGTRGSATYDDLRNVPEHLVAEIVDGELVTSPRPAVRHAAAASSVLSGLFAAFDRRGGGAAGTAGWIILIEPELHIVDQVLVPDLAAWRHERMPVLPDVAFIDQAPDWICEVLSPSTIALDRTRKMHHYARARVSHLWFLDPHPETLEVYRLEGSAWQVVMTVAGNARVRAEPFDAIEMDLTSVWAR